MPGWLQLFALARFGRPVILFVAVYVLLWLAMQVPLLRRRAGSVIALGRSILIVTACLAIAAFVAVAVWYASDRRYYDFAEPTMPAVAWMFDIGKPLYPAPDAAERYAHIYGPMAFVPLGVAMYVFGTDLLVTKWIGTGAAILALAALFLILQARLGTRASVVFSGYCALLLLVFRNAAFWVRPDSLELLCVSVGLWAVMDRSPVSWIVLGLSAGVLWNLKFSGPLYSLPLFALFAERADRRRMIFAIATAVLVFSLPFGVRNISFTGYLTWILLSGKNGIVWSTLRQNIEWVLYLIAPLTVAVALGGRQHPVTALSRGVAISLLMTLGSVAVLASKPGAGAYHLLPFLPLIVFLTAMQIHQLRIEDIPHSSRLAAVAFTAVAMLIALAQQTSFIGTVREIDATGPISDVRRFAVEHPGAVTEMGYSSDERMTFVRPLLVSASGTYLLDQPAIQEHQLAGVEIPAATRDALRACVVRYWLIPKTGEPFSAINRYPMMHGRPLFDDDLRRAFFESYARSGSTKYFDVWSCRRISAPAARD